MDLNQRKLTKAEWTSIEVPITGDEQEVLKLIVDGYNNVNIRFNNNSSLLGYLKMDYSKEMEDYLYIKYFSEKIATIHKENPSSPSLFEISINTNPSIKKGDLIRINMNNSSKMKIDSVFEYIIIDMISKMLYESRKNNTIWLSHYFTIYKFLRINITKLNRHVIKIAQNILTHFEDEIIMEKMIENGVSIIEKNVTLLKYADMMLYEHQRKLFTIIKKPDIPLIKKDSTEEDNVNVPHIPKLILYIAPTGTGKTLSPIGMSNEYKIIFVCAARHVGLALAKAAISIGKKIAFAFGCSSASDIRLHYFAAKEYTKHRRSGGIGKVDNSVGDKVEIMICDIKSYLPAMYYMLSFNSAENIFTYWDEPTITMDYEEHELHKIINSNWRENLIPNMVLSSATLPKYHEINDVIADFRGKFDGAEIHNIISHDCKKSIPILNKNGRVVLPHYLSEDYDEILRIVSHCEDNLTLLRYFDLKEVIDFIIYIEKNSYLIGTSNKMNRKFASMEDIDMQNIKLHYLHVLKNIMSGTWGSIYLYFKINRLSRLQSNDSVDVKGVPIRKANSIGPGVTLKSSNPTPASKSLIETDTTVFSCSNMEGKPISRIASQQVPSTTAILPVESQPGIYITTKDAFTLTDGPTIFLADNVEKIAKFYIQQANIPAKVVEDITTKIEFNNKLNEKIDELENELEDVIEKFTMKTDLETHKIADAKVKTITGSDGRNVKKIEGELEALRGMIKSAQLNEMFIPNKVSHFNKWAADMSDKNIFTSDVDEHSIIDIMSLKDVADSWKILLLMGIGVFTNHPSIAYTEIMKKMADSQKLYMIIASSDYIYGTNYQFCHGYLSKDLSLTQEKIIQALGRIGRNNIQQDYTIRLRDDSQITKLFYHEDNKIEVRMMNRLFNSDTIL